MSSQNGQSDELSLKRRPGGRTQETSDKVREATIALLLEGGINAVSYQAVAKRSGVGRATLYRRWENVAALVAFAVSETAAQNVEIADIGTLKEDLTFVLGNIARFASSPIGVAALAANLSLPKQNAGDAEETYWTRRADDIHGIFERARDRGEIAADIDVDVAFARLAGAVYFRLFVMGETANDDWIQRLLLDL